MIRRDRRQFLRWASATSGVLLVGAGCRGSDPGAAEPDASFACPPTRGDVQGPFFEPGAPMRNKLAADDEPGERLLLTGVVSGDDCAPIAGALLDVWQADATGAYHAANTAFRLRGQLVTGADGAFSIETIRPGNYTLADNSWRPAHIHFTISRPGFASLTTQLYFAGDPYLPPNDGCGSGCGSDDPERVIPLGGDAGAGWQGAWNVTLRRT